MMRLDKIILIVCSECCLKGMSNQSHMGLERAQSNEVAPYCLAVAFPLTEYDGNNWK